MKLHTFLFYLGLLFCSFAIATDETCKEKLAKTGAAVSETKKSEVAPAPKKEAPDFNNSIDVQVVDSYARLAMKGEPSFSSRLIEWFLNTIAQPFGLRKVNRVMAAMRDDARDVSLAQKAMDAFRIKVETDGSDISTIPATGGLLVVANHPLSGIEGFAIAAKLASVRPDVKIVANEVLKKVPGTEDMIIGVDVMNPESRENMKAYREMQKWVKEGHVLLIFPAGNVSRYQPETKIVADPPWSRSIAKIAKKNDAPVLPIFVHGQPGALFQTLDSVNPKLGSSAVPREMLRQDGTTVKLTIGSAIPSEEVAKFEDDGDAVAFLRGKTYELGGITETPAN